jgi:hypothetical protein
MGEVSSLGRMEESMMGITQMIRNKEEESLYGLMEENMMGNGSMVSNMEKEFIIPQKVK